MSLNHIGILGPNKFPICLQVALGCLKGFGEHVVVRGVSCWDSGQNWANLIKPEDNLIGVDLDNSNKLKKIYWLVQARVLLYASVMFVLFI